MTFTTNTNNKLTLNHFAGATPKAINIVLGWTGEEATIVNPYKSHSGLEDGYADKVNPTHAVPSLFIPSENKDDNAKPLVLTQNLAVLTYAAKRAGRQDLAGGDDLIDQTEVLEWLSFLGFC